MASNGEIGIDKVYVVHGIKGYDAREKMVNDLLKEQAGLDFEFVTESWDEEENKQLLEKYFAPDISELLPRSFIYCTLVHILCYEKIVQSKSPLSIIFENDICFLGDFVEDMKPISREAKTLPEGFIISLENSTLQFPSWRKIKAGRHLYPASSGRCAGAYMVDLKAAELMLEDVKNHTCKKVIDWWHNDLIDRNIVKMYWAHPPVTEQGSFNGKFMSSNSTRRDGRIRRIKWLAQKYYKMYLLRWFR